MSDDESLARLRAADPAEGQASDLAALRRAVDARLGEDAPGAGKPAVAAATSGDELAARRAGRFRRREWLAAAAAVLVVGVGGYMAGAGTAGNGAGDAADVAYEDSGDAADGEAPTVLDSADEQAEMGSNDGVGADDSAVTDGDSLLAAGRSVFEASGLSDEAGSAEVFAYDPAGVGSADRVAEIAASLGIAGDVTERDGAWRVADDEGRTVELYDDATATLRYLDPTVDPTACAVAVNDTSSPDELGSCDAASTPVDPVATARQHLATTGVDTDALRLVADDSGTGAVDVHGYLADATTPTWTVTVTVDGVYTARGWLAPLVSLGSYDVVSPVTAVDRLTDPRFAAEPGGLSADDTTAESAPAPGPIPAPGDPVPWPVEVRTITAAELTLAAYPMPDGVVLLLPTWSLTSDDGGTWRVLALTESALDLEAVG